MYNSKLFEYGCACYEIAENGEIHPILYKYAKFDCGLKILESGKIRFSESTNLNDIFDGQFPIGINNFGEDCNWIIDELANENGLTEEEKPICHAIMQDSNYREKVINNAVENVKRNFGISCFSRQRDNPLMWGNYGDAHKGIILKFDKLNDVDFFKDFFPINYTSSMYPDFNVAKSIPLTDCGILEKILLSTKSPEWQHEDEVRVIMRSKGDIPIKKVAIVEVIFGCQVSDDNKALFVKTAKENGWEHLKYSVAKKKQDQAGLDFSEYKTT